MTNKEAINVMRKYTDTESGISKAAAEAHSMAIKALEQEPRWIPVSEKLPEENRAVLTYIDTGTTKTYCLACWNDRCEAWEEWIGHNLIKDRGYKVIAWMPLSKPYKAESEG